MLFGKSLNWMLLVVTLASAYRLQSRYASVYAYNQTTMNSNSIEFTTKQQELDKQSGIKSPPKPSLPPVIAAGIPPLSTSTQSLDARGIRSYIVYHLAVA